MPAIRQASYLRTEVRKLQRQDFTNLIVDHTEDAEPTGFRKCLQRAHTLNFLNRTMPPLIGRWVERLKGNREIKVSDPLEIGYR